MPTVSPAVVTSAEGMTVAYVQSETGRITLNSFRTPQNTWSGEQTVGATAVTASTPALVRLGADDHLVVWHGFNDTGIYYARGTAGQWSEPGVILKPAETTSAPVALPGVGGKAAEVLFTAGGTLRHARYDGATFAVTEVPATSSAVSVSATIVPAP